MLLYQIGEHGMWIYIDIGPQGIWSVLDQSASSRLQQIAQGSPLTHPKTSWGKRKFSDHIGRTTFWRVGMMPSTSVICCCWRVRGAGVGGMEVVGDDIWSCNSIGSGGWGNGQNQWNQLWRIWEVGGMERARTNKANFDSWGLLS